MKKFGQNSLFKKLLGSDPRCFIVLLGILLIPVNSDAITAMNSAGVDMFVEVDISADVDVSPSSITEISIPTAVEVSPLIVSEVSVISSPTFLPPVVPMIPNTNSSTDTVSSVSYSQSYSQDMTAVIGYATVSSQDDIVYQSIQDRINESQTVNHHLPVFDNGFKGIADHMETQGKVITSVSKLTISSADVIAFDVAANGSIAIGVDQNDVSKVLSEEDQVSKGIERMAGMKGKKDTVLLNAKTLRTLVRHVVNTENSPIADAVEIKDDVIKIVSSKNKSDFKVNEVTDTIARRVANHDINIIDASIDISVKNREVTSEPIVNIEIDPDPVLEEGYKILPEDNSKILPFTEIAFFDQKGESPTAVSSHNGNYVLIGEPYESNSDEGTSITSNPPGRNSRGDDQYHNNGPPQVDDEDSDMGGSNPGRSEPEGPSLPNYGAGNNIGYNHTSPPENDPDDSSNDIDPSADHNQWIPINLARGNPFDFYSDRSSWLKEISISLKEIFDEYCKSSGCQASEFLINGSRLDIHGLVETSIQLRTHFTFPRVFYGINVVFILRQENHDLETADSSPPGHVPKLS